MKKPLPCPALLTAFVADKAGWGPEFQAIIYLHLAIEVLKVVYAEFNKQLEEMLRDLSVTPFQWLRSTRRNSGSG